MICKQLSQPRSIIKNDIIVVRLVTISANLSLYSNSTANGIMVNPMGRINTMVNIPLYEFYTFLRT